MSKLRFVGLNVHKDTIVVAVAEEGQSEAVALGIYPHDVAKERVRNNFPMWLRVTRKISRNALASGSECRSTLEPDASLDYSQRAIGC